MDVILDSNIFRSDILLRSKEFDILLDYLSKTESALIVPQIVYDEISGLYIRTLKERINELIKAINNVNLTLTDIKNHLKLPDIDLSIEKSKYEAFIKKQLKIQDNHIIAYNNDYLPEISRRAINRQKPAGDQGQGFRDTMIWLTLKDYCKNCREKQITFISNNTADFANPDKDALHEFLIEECTEYDIKINYFKTLKEFIENHSTKIDFINEEWVLTNLDYASISNLALDYLNGKENKSIIYRIARDNGYACEGYRALSIDPSINDSPTVYEMADNRLIVNVIIDAEIQIEFDYSQGKFYPPSGFEDYYSHVERDISSTIQYIKAVFFVSIIVKNREILEIELIDFDY